MKNPWYLRKWIWLLIMTIALLIPFVINEAYKCEDGYLTKWGAEDVLAFYGSFLAFAGTVILGLVTMEQTRKANQMTEKMLEIEERHEMPILDVLEITEEYLPDKAGSLANAVQLFLNDSYYFISRENTLKEGDTDIVVFLLKNITDNYMISMEMKEIAYVTKFQNGEVIPSDITEFSWTGGIRVFGCGERQYFVIGGIHCQYPAGMTTEELFQKGCHQPSILLDLTFLLKNTRGRIYEEKIRLHYCYLPANDGIQYPCILEKEILYLKAMDA